MIPVCYTPQYLLNINIFILEFSLEFLKYVYKYILMALFITVSPPVIILF